jgi:hypothetical protein
MLYNVICFKIFRFDLFLFILLLLGGLIRNIWDDFVSSLLFVILSCFVFVCSDIYQNFPILYYLILSYLNFLNLTLSYLIVSRQHRQL